MYRVISGKQPDRSLKMCNSFHKLFWKLGLRNVSQEGKTRENPILLLQRCIPNLHKCSRIDQFVNSKQSERIIKHNSLIIVCEVAKHPISCCPVDSCFPVVPGALFYFQFFYP